MPQRDRRIKFSAFFESVSTIGFVCSYLAKVMYVCLNTQIPLPCYAAHRLLEEALGNQQLSPAGKPPVINCEVTSGSLVPSIAKCMTYRLDDVLSSSDNGTSLMSQYWKQ